MAEVLVSGVPATKVTLWVTLGSSLEPSTSFWHEARERTAARAANDLIKLFILLPPPLIIFFCVIVQTAMGTSCTGIAKTRAQTYKALKLYQGTLAPRRDVLRLGAKLICFVHDNIFFDSTSDWSGGRAQRKRPHPERMRPVYWRDYPRIWLTYKRLISCPPP